MKKIYKVFSRVKLDTQKRILTTKLKKCLALVFKEQKICYNLSVKSQLKV